MCSGFGIRGPQGLVMGASYDFFYGQGLVLTNARGLLKRGLADGGDAAPEWASRYGSITFNQFGKELPTCGMNEKGLAIHLFELAGGSPQSEDARPFLNELQWIQHKLDQCATVDEALAGLDRIRIRRTFFVLQYLLCDARGGAAVVSTGPSGLVARRFRADETIALANHSIEHADSAFRKARSSRPVPPPTGFSSQARYARIRHLLGGYRPEGEPGDAKFAFQVLDRVFRKPRLLDLFRWLFLRKPPVTSFWNTVFEIPSLSIHFRTAKDRCIRTLKLAEVDFSPHSRAMALDLDALPPGENRPALSPYSHGLNLRLIRRSFASVSKQFPERDQEALAGYPETFIRQEADGPQPLDQEILNGNRI